MSTPSTGSARKYSFVIPALYLVVLTSIQAAMGRPWISWFSSLCSRSHLLQSDRCQAGHSRPSRLQLGRVCQPQRLRQRHRLLCALNRARPASGHRSHKPRPRQQWRFRHDCHHQRNTSFNPEHDLGRLDGFPGQAYHSY